MCQKNLRIMQRDVEELIFLINKRGELSDPFDLSVELQICITAAFYGSTANQNGFQHFLN